MLTTNNPNPLLSIITVTFNAEKVLERTLLSIGTKQPEAVEYLIIDGASTDGTLALVEKYLSIVNACISEPDKGIYDAMNKGLAQARGQYVWFMNAGDQLFDNQTIDRIFGILEAQNPDVVYGETLLVNDANEGLGLRSEITPHKLPQNLTWQHCAMGMVVCHQSLIVRKTLAPVYRLDHFYSADIDWEIKVLKTAQRIVKTDFILSRYLIGGFSIQNLKRSLYDRFVILAIHFGFWRTLWNHGKILIRGGLKILRGGKYW